MKDELSKMSEVNDPDKNLKNPEESRKLKEFELHFTEIQKDVMNVIVQKCENNPL